MRPLLWRLVERTLRRRLPPDRLTPVLGDLAEDFEARLEKGSRFNAQWWLVREALSVTHAYGERPVRRALAARLWTDLRHGWRSMRARPGASVAVALVLAVGVGIVSTMFALTDPYLLRPLPYRNPDELVTVQFSTLSRDVPTLRDWQARTNIVAGVTASGKLSETVVRHDDLPASISHLQIARNYFEVLGISVRLPENWRPAYGRGEMPLVLTIDGATRLGGRSRAIGSFLPFDDGQPGGFRVVGALSSSFVNPFTRPGQRLDGFVPLGDEPLIRVETRGTGYSSSSLDVIARLRPGVSPDVVAPALSTGVRDHLGRPPTEGIAVWAERPGERASQRVTSMAIGALVAGVLIMLISAANVANLLLARGASRMKEFASREALGASGFDMARLVLVELALLTSAGVLLGLGVAKMLLVAFAQVIPAEYTVFGMPDISGRVVGLAVLSAALVMMAGLLPAWGAWRVKPPFLISRVAISEGRTARALRFGMTAVQTALAVILLVGAALFGRSYWNLVSQDPGYDGDVVAIRVLNSSSLRNDPTELPETLAALKRLSGATSSAAIFGPFVDNMQMASVGRPLTVDGQAVSGGSRQVTASFFETMNTRLLAGHYPDSSEALRSSVISESFALKCCGEPGKAVGRVLTDRLARPTTIQAVVKDIFNTALDQKPGALAFFIEAAPAGPVTFVVRASAVDASFPQRAEAEIRRRNPAAAILGGSLADRLMRSINDRSFATLIVICFAIAAAGISAAGIVGVVGFVVARRTREVAIRLAIGSSRAAVARLVTREAVLAATVGAVVGLTTGGWLSTLIESQFYGVRPADPISMLAAAAVLVALVFVSAWWPARRASRLAPTTALRLE